MAEVQSEIEGGVEINSVQLPMVISCAKGMAEQRIPNMMGIMNAKKKPLEVIAASQIQSTLHIEQFELPEAKSSVQMISPDHIDQLVDVLSKELKII